MISLTYKEVEQLITALYYIDLPEYKDIEIKLKALQRGMNGDYNE